MEAIESMPGVSLKKIMFATDFSPVATLAGEYVRALALRFGSEVHIVHVYACFDEGLEGVVPGQQQTGGQQLIEQWNEFRAAGIGTSVSLTSECPTPDALLLKERQFGPDLIVVGTEPKSPVGRFLLGSTAEHLIRSAISPVLTIAPNSKPPQEGPLSFKRIVFAADFSDASNRAGAFALAFAREAGAHLWICHIATSSTAGKANPSDDAGQRQFREQLTSFIPREAYDWCTLEYALQHGNPARGILDVAERVHADLIIMGARARSFWLMHVRRGVTQDVLAEANCPVLTVQSLA
ncbi:MAG TPA: universal stress protein [Acidobacteriaceae bacterium]|nr:universal stress protein [Acidobacteriaceae bacterium]